MDDFHYVDGDGCSWPDYQHAITGGLLGLCGCGDDSIHDDIAAVLTRYYEAEERDQHLRYTELLPDAPRKYTELILHLLDNADLIEHGISIHWNWLTDHGTEVARKLIAEAEAGE